MKSMFGRVSAWVIDAAANSRHPQISGLMAQAPASKSIVCERFLFLGDRTAFGASHRTTRHRPQSSIRARRAE
jgi:hypothetical protein